MRALLLGAILVLSACAQNDSSLMSAGESLRDEAVHALMAERIDSLYRRIEVLAFDQNRTLPELDEDRRRVANDIVATAGELADAAAELTTLSLLPETLNLSAATRQQFQNLSVQLQQSSEEVARAAEDLSSTTLATSIVGLQATCATCHNLYRGQ